MKETITDDIQNGISSSSQIPSSQVGMKIWVKFEDKTGMIDLEGCEFVSDLRDKIRGNSDFGISSNQHIILKWKNQQLKLRAKISSLDLLEAIHNPQDDTSFFLIVQLDDQKA